MYSLILYVMQFNCLDTCKCFLTFVYQLVFIPIKPFIHSFLWLCTASVHSTTQNSSDNLPSYLQTSIIAQMLSIGGEGQVTLERARRRGPQRRTCWRVKGLSENWGKIPALWGMGGSFRLAPALHPGVEPTPLSFDQQCHKNSKQLSYANDTDTSTYLYVITSVVLRRMF